MSTITYTAADELDRRAHNRANPGQKIPAPNTPEGRMFFAMSKTELKALASEPVPAPTPEVVATVPTWAAPGPRGGDPVKRLRGELASRKAEKGTPEWWAEYRATKGESVEALGAKLGYC